MRMTKRDFLHSVGAAAGVEAVYRTMQALGLSGAAEAAPLDLPRGSGQGKSVVVLGAGVSGMTAAHELSKAGYHCTILEATGRAGGRNLTARGGDVIAEFDSRQRVEFDDREHLYANLGPARIPYHHRTILGYCKEFGVELEVFTNDNRAALFHNRDRFGGKPVEARRVVTDTRGYVAELLAKPLQVAAGVATARRPDLLRRRSGDRPPRMAGGRRPGRPRRGERDRRAGREEITALRSRTPDRSASGERRPISVAKTGRCPGPRTAP